MRCEGEGEGEGEVVLRERGAAHVHVHAPTCTPTCTQVCMHLSLDLASISKAFSKLHPDVPSESVRHSSIVLGGVGGTPAISPNLRISGCRGASRLEGVPAGGALGPIVSLSLRARSHSCWA